MDAEHKIWSNIDHDLTSNLLSKISLTVECSICSDTMNIPYTLECGHTFCYECLKNWFRNKLNCPSCRFNILHKPILNISLKEITKNIQDLKIELNDDNNEDKLKLINHRNEQFETYEADKVGKSLFDNVFNHTSITVMDNSDGVPRCGNCHWEARGPICNHCGFRIQDPNDDNRSRSQEFYYDSMEGEDYDEDGDDDDVDIDGDMGIPDEQYDSEDSFVDTRGLTEIMLETNSNDDLLSTDEDDEDYDSETIHHRPRSVHSEESDWQGFESPANSTTDIADHDHDHIHEHHHAQHHQAHHEADAIELSDEEDDVNSSRQYYDSEDLRDALEEFHETELHHISSEDDDEPRIVIRRSRGGANGGDGTNPRSRRMEVVISDDEDD